VPILFSEDPAATSKEFTDNPRQAFDYYQILQARLMDTERITKEQATEFLANPTLGRTKSPLVRTWESFAGGTSAETPKKASKAEKGMLHLI